MSTFVKSPLVFLAAVSALGAFKPTVGLASAPLVTQPHAVQSAATAELVSRARRAFSRFAAACLARDPARIAQAVTDNMVVEYDLPDPGMTLTVDAAELDGLCGASAQREAGDHVSNVLVFPTSDPNVFFIQYDAPSQPDSSSSAEANEHLVIVELRGDRVSRIRDFPMTTGEIASIATGSPHNTLP